MKAIKRKIALILAASLIMTNAMVSLAEPLSGTEETVNETEVAALQQNAATPSDALSVDTDSSSATPSDAIADGELIFDLLLGSATPSDEGITTWAQLQAAIDDAGTECSTIELTQSLEAEETDEALYIGDGQDIILDLNGFKLDRDLYAGDETLLVDHGGVFEVYDGGRLTLMDSEDNGIIVGGVGKAGKGGAVYIEDGGSFILDGGEINGCTAENGGTVYCAGSFHMTGGSISYSKAQDYGGGVYVDSTGTFTMSGGEIIGGEATIGGGCIFVGGLFELTGGTVSSGIANALDGVCGGGGILVAEGAEAAVSGGAVIDNYAKYGGGISNFGKITITGGRIAGNSALFAAGVGNEKESLFIMRGGEISGNTANLACGGVSNSGTFQMTGGQISDNKAGEIGGIETAGGLLILDEKPVIINNSDGFEEESNVFLAEETIILFGENIAGGAIGVKTEIEPDLSGNKIKIAEGSVQQALPYITSDAGYKVTNDGDALYLSMSFEIEKESGTAVYGDGPDSSGILYRDKNDELVLAEASLIWTDGKAPSAYTMVAEEGQLCIKPCNEAGTAFADAGTWSFKVKIGEIESENAVEFTVEPREANITWSGDSLVYNGKPQAPEASVGNRISGDDVSVEVSGQQTSVGNGYTAAAEGLTGENSGNYTLPNPKPVKNFNIVARKPSGGGSAVQNNTMRFSPNWYKDENGTWRIRNNAGAVIANAWLCDDAFAANEKNAWFLLGTDGAMLATGLVQDNTGNFYSLETEPTGYFGMLRYKDGCYNCNGQNVYLTFNREDRGSFGAITNAEGLEKLKAIYGVTKYNIGNESAVYTSSF